MRDSWEVILEEFKELKKIRVEMGKDFNENKRGRELARRMLLMVELMMLKSFVMKDEDKTPETLKILEEIRKINNELREMEGLK